MSIAGTGRIYSFSKEWIPFVQLRGRDIVPVKSSPSPRLWSVISSLKHHRNPFTRSDEKSDISIFPILPVISRDFNYFGSFIALVA
jgi:hypothetical protein